MSNNVERTYWGNKNLHYELAYRKGKKHGTEKHYYENGKFKKAHLYNKGSKIAILKPRYDDKIVF